MVTLRSDAVFMDEEGNYTVYHEKVRQEIAKYLGITDTRLKTSVGYTGDYIQTKVLNGYHAKWNLKKQSVPAIAAGSAFSFVLETDLKEYPEYIGERNIEGLGRISITNIKDCCYCIDELDTQEMTNKILHLDNFPFLYLQSADCTIKGSPVFFFEDFFKQILVCFSLRVILLFLHKNFP